MTHKNNIKEYYVSLDDAKKSYDEMLHMIAIESEKRKEQQASE